MVSHFSDFTIGAAIFFYFIFFAPTSKEHINHVPGEVTFNETPTVADKIKLEY